MGWTDGHAICMEELVIVHYRLDGKSVEECHFAGVCLSGRIDFETWLKSNGGACDCLRKYVR
jgi:hypothetical protein